jgi:UDP-N-acetylmuramate dehydrogenase
LRSDAGLIQALHSISGLTLEVAAPLARHTTIKVGGPADLLLSVRATEALAACLACLARYDVPFIVLGNGSNILVSDRGIRGAVLRLVGTFRGVRWEEQSDRIVADVGAGYAVSRLVRDAIRRGLGGLEFAEGIPGSVGGSLVMNAGAYGSEMEKLVLSVEGLTPEGEPMVLEREALRFSYRQTELPRQTVVTRVRLALTKEDPAVADERMRAIMAQRKASQPVGYPNCGSVFRNPPGDHAGRLIEAAGLKGVRRGQAEVSRRHANFILNRGGARAQDVRELIEYVKGEVERRFSVKLETEVRFVGDWGQLWRA